MGGGSILYSVYITLQTTDTDPAFSQCSIVGRMDDGGVYSLYRMIGCCSTIDTQTISTQYLHNIYTISTHPRHNWARPIFNTGWCQLQLHFQLCRLSGRLSSNMNKYNGHNPRHRNITDVSTTTALSAPQHHSIIRQVSCPLVSRALV